MSAFYIDKGYRYLELKEWKKAKEFFETSIVNNDDKAKAYIGRLLAKLKVSEIDDLANCNKLLSKFDDFNLAIKYADEEFKQSLNGYLAAVEQRKIKSKKRIMLLLSFLLLIVALLVLSYYVFMPLGRYSHYKSLLSKNEIIDATNSYSSSTWFEYDKKVKMLFYNSGVSLVESEDYKNAARCFDIIGKYKNSANYSAYCKAQILLENGDMRAYDYFKDCQIFLDSSDILKTNSYLSTIDKLQGKWYINKNQKDIELKQKGEMITGDNFSYQVILTNDEVMIDGGENFSLYKNNTLMYGRKNIKIIDDNHIEIGDVEYYK